MNLVITRFIFGCGLVVSCFVVEFTQVCFSALIVCSKVHVYQYQRPGPVITHPTFK